MVANGRIAKGAGALVVALSLLAVVPAVPVLGLSKHACRVTDTDSGVTKRTLAAAVAAAVAGEHLTVRGVCHGITTIDKPLSIRGIRPKGAAKPTLDGDALGTVIRVVDGATVVTIAKLTITGGDAEFGGGVYASTGATTLRDVVARGNTAGYGGGVFLFGAVVTLAGATVIRANSTTTDNGGGAYVSGNEATLVMSDTSRVVDNTSAFSGGGVWVLDGTLRMDGSSSIEDNHVGQRGAGAAIVGDGTLSMSGSSSIHHNVNTGNSGGGIFADYGTITITDAASIHDNGAVSIGGGVLILHGVFDVSALCGAGKAVHDNTPVDCTDQRP